MKFKLTLFILVLAVTSKVFASTQNTSPICNLNDPKVIKGLPPHRDLIKNLYYVDEQLSVMPIFLLNARNEEQSSNIKATTLRLKKEKAELTTSLNKLTTEQKICLLQDLYNSTKYAQYPKESYQRFFTAADLFTNDKDLSKEEQKTIVAIIDKAEQEQVQAKRNTASAKEENPFFFNKIGVIE